jgi:hypothetical protein
MHVKSTEGTTEPMIPKTYTFVDAVSTYGDRISQVELSEAYRRAGTAFKGQMEQVFVLLRESNGASRYQNQRRQHQPRGAGFRGGPERKSEGRKRPREDDEGASGSGSSRGKRGKGPYRGKHFQRGKY